MVLAGFAWILIAGWFPQWFGDPDLPRANTLITGDCFVTEGADQLPVACDQPHDGEVFGTASWDGSSEFPGPGRLELWANDSCVPLFEQYVGTGIGETALEVGMLFPTAATWAEGDRKALCVARFPGDRTIGSLANSGR